MPKKAIATLATIAVNIVMVNAVVKRGEKVLNAYMMLSPFVLIVVCVIDGLARLFSLSALLLSIVTNGVSPHRVVAALYAHKRKVSSFFLIFFSWGVGAWVWARGCGGVGRRDTDGAGRMKAG